MDNTELEEELNGLLEEVEDLNKQLARQKLISTQLQMENERLVSVIQELYSEIESIERLGDGNV